jgi:hypothetical protein
MFMSTCHAPAHALWYSVVVMDKEEFIKIYSRFVSMKRLRLQSFIALKDGVFFTHLMTF